MWGGLVWSYKLNASSFFILVNVFPTALIKKKTFTKEPMSGLETRVWSLSRPVMTGSSLVGYDFGYLVECSSKTASSMQLTLLWTYLEDVEHLSVCWTAFTLYPVAVCTSIKGITFSAWTPEVAAKCGIAARMHSKLPQEQRSLCSCHDNIIWGSVASQIPLRCFRRTRWNTTAWKASQMFCLRVRFVSPVTAVMLLLERKYTI